MRAGSRLLNASTQAAVAAATWSLGSAGAATTAGGADVVVGALDGAPLISASLLTVPTARNLVLGISPAAACAPTGSMLAQSNFGSTTKTSARPAMKSRSMRASVGFDAGPPRQRTAMDCLPEAIRKRVYSPDLRSNTGRSPSVM